MSVDRFIYMQRVKSTMGTNLKKRKIQKYICKLILPQTVCVVHRIKIE